MSNPSVIVTGAGSGIGAATALRFAREGWDVVLVGRRESALSDTEKKILSLPAQDRKPKTAIFCLDLGSLDAESKAAVWLNENPAIAASLTCVVHNAGIFKRSPSAETTDSDWHRLFETNVFGVIRLTRALWPVLKANRGSIVVVSSTLGLRPIPDTGAYSASKAAVINWTQSFALEAAPHGVRVNCVCPGLVDTPIHGTLTEADHARLAPLQPLGRVGKPEEIAHMIFTLAGPGSEWTTGAIVSVDGGIVLT